MVGVRGFPPFAGKKRGVEHPTPLVCSFHPSYFLAVGSAASLLLDGMRLIMLHGFALYQT
jgi:hypothetical protein